MVTQSDFQLKYTYLIRFDDLKQYGKAGGTVEFSCVFTVEG